MAPTWILGVSAWACTTFWMEMDEPQEGSESASLSKKAKGQGSRPYLLTLDSLSLLFLYPSPPFHRSIRGNHHEPLPYHGKQRFWILQNPLAVTGAGAGDSWSRSRRLMRAWDARAGVSNWTTWLRGTFAQRLRSLAQFVEKGGWSWNWRFGVFLFTGEVDTVVPTVLVFLCVCLMITTTNMYFGKGVLMFVWFTCMNYHPASAPFQSWISKRSIWRNLKANS